jgi:WD40 repeat protein
VRVLISYAHDDAVHEDRVRDFWLFLRKNSIDARIDLPAAERRQRWPQWMTREIRDADRVLVIASPEYKRRAEGDAAPDEGRGVQWEAGLIQELFYADQDAGLQTFVPVVLPGCSEDDIPLWMGPKSTTHYQVSDYTVAGAEKLLRLLTRQPSQTVPDLGPTPVLPPRGNGSPSTTGPATGSRVAAAPPRLPGTPPKPLQRIDGSSPVNAVSWDPDGRRIAVASKSATVSAYDVSGPVARGQLSVSTGGLPTTRVHDVAYSWDGARLASATSFSKYRSMTGGTLPKGTAAVWDATTGEQRLEIPHDRAVTAVAFSPDDTWLATASADGRARIWDAASGQQRLEVRHGGAVTAVAFSPNGIRLATASADGSARIWDAATGLPLLEIPVGSAVAAVAFGLDGTVLATGSADGSARIWDAATGQLLLDIPVGSAVAAVAISPDGMWLATGSADGSARIWDAANGQLLLDIPVGSAVAAVEFSPDGTRLAVGSADGSVRIWAVGPSRGPADDQDH